MKEILVLIFIGSLFLILPLIIIDRRRSEKKYSEFLHRNNGKNFFCYNNRKDSKKFIESNILPILPINTNIIYLNGKNIESEYPKEFISKALYQLKSYQKFPHLLKIRNGKLEDKSINNLFYSILNQNIPQGKLSVIITNYFDMTLE